MHRDLTAFAAGPGKRIVAQIPPITLHQGTLSTPEAHPYAIIDPETGDTLALIDTSGNERPEGAADAGLLVTRDRVVFRRNAVETRSFAVDELARHAGVEDGTLTTEELGSFVDGLAGWLPVAVFPFALTISYAYRVALGLLYGLVALVFGNLLRVTLPFDAAFRLGIVALTPAVALQSVAELASQQLSGVLYVLVALGYLFAAVQANSERAGTAEGEAAGD